MFTNQPLHSQFFQNYLMRNRNTFGLLLELDYIYNANELEGILENNLQISLNNQ